MVGDHGVCAPYQKLTAEEIGVEKQLKFGDYGNGLETWHCNLMAASQRENMLFIAVSDKIQVYRPSRPLQRIQNQLVEVVSPHKFWDYEKPKEAIINNIAVGELGPLEVVAIVQDEGHVTVWATNDLSRPIFMTRVEDSAWGIAFHKESRRLAISDNSHSIKVYELGTSADEAKFRERYIAEFESDIVRKELPLKRGLFTEDAGYGRDNDNWSLPKTRNLKSEKEKYKYAWKTVFENQVRILPGHENNIPSVSFLNDKSGRWLASAGIDSCYKIWDLRAGQEVMIHEFNDQSYGWNVQFLLASDFLPMKTLEDAIGVRAGTDPQRRRVTNLKTHSNVRRVPVANGEDAYDLNKLDLVDFPTRRLGLNQTTLLASMGVFHEMWSDDDDDFAFDVFPDSAESTDYDEHGHEELSDEDSELELEQHSFDDSYVSSLLQEMEESYQAGSDDDDDTYSESESEEDSSEESEEEDQSECESDMGSMPDLVPASPSPQLEAEAAQFAEQYASHNISNQQSDEEDDEGDVPMDDIDALFNSDEQYSDSENGIHYQYGTPNYPGGDYMVEEQSSEEEEYEVGQTIYIHGNGSYDLEITVPGSSEEEEEEDDDEPFVPSTPVNFGNYTMEHLSAALSQTPHQQLPQSSPGGSILDVAGTPLALPPPQPTFTSPLNNITDDEETVPTEPDDEDYDGSLSQLPKYKMPPSRQIRRAVPSNPPPSAVFGSGSHRTSLLTSPNFTLNCTYFAYPNYAVHQLDRLHLVVRIPELHYLFAGSQRGSVYAFRLTRFKDQLLYRLDHILPKPDETIAAMQRGPLVGLAVTPMQGHFPADEEKRKKRRPGLQRRRWRLFMLFAKGVMQTYDIGRKLEGEEISVDAC